MPSSVHGLRERAAQEPRQALRLNLSRPFRTALHHGASPASLAAAGARTTVSAPCCIQVACTKKLFVSRPHADAVMCRLSVLREVDDEYIGAAKSYVDRQPAVRSPKPGHSVSLAAAAQQHPGRFAAELQQRRRRRSKMTQAPLLSSAPVWSRQRFRRSADQASALSA